jgi:predicted metal-dependent hydrolase
MTDLQVRKLRFGFGDSAVPFLWNESNPAFSAGANALSFFAIAFEQMISAMIREAMPLITDPEIADEAQAFVRQEGQHCMAHRQHAKALIQSHPALRETLDAAIDAFDKLTATTPLNYRLAYTANLEATFTPSFKLMLDNAGTLFAPGDDRVASLFIWHFVEEVEHRSSALTIYNAIVDDPWYRLRVVRSMYAHIGAVVQTIADGFNKHVPLSQRKVDAMSMAGTSNLIDLLLRKPHFGVSEYGPLRNAYANVPLRQQLAAVFGVLRSQIPGHNPTNVKLPALAAEWFSRYDAGYDVTRWYTAARDLPA